MAIIRVVDVDVYYGSYRALNKVSIIVKPREVIGVVGPNGAGKTTLLKTINGILKPKIGTVYINNKELISMKRREIAKLIGYVPQRASIFTHMTVLDFVLTGRRPYIRLGYSNKDFEEAIDALKLVNALHLAKRKLDQLSGGEFQRIIIARALVAKPQVLLLDEPTTNLDPYYQVEILRLVRKLAIEREMAIIMSLHDLTHAYRFSDKIIMLKDGKIFAIGKPEEVITSKNVREVFGLEPIVLKEFKAVVFR